MTMKNTVVTLQKQKHEHDKITMVTAYDYTTAKIMDESGVNTILVGDSLGMVMLGYEDTLSVTMEDMIHHTAAVTRGAKNAFVVADMPFMSYQTSVYDAVVNAGRLMKEGRANAVKLEGGVEFAPHIKAIAQASIPVVAHLGLTPQSVNAFGGFKVQGKDIEAAQKLIEDGRIAIGPWYVLQDEFLTSSESNVRNLQMGYKLAQEFGGKWTKIGYFPDSFGNMGNGMER